jgi:hypothetical protein
VLQRARDEGEPLEGLRICEHARVGQLEEVQTPRLGILGLMKQWRPCRSVAATTSPTRVPRTPP